MRFFSIFYMSEKWRFCLISNKWLFFFWPVLKNNALKKQAGLPIRSTKQLTFGNREPKYLQVFFLENKSIPHPKSFQLFNDSFQVFWGVRTGDRNRHLFYLSQRLGSTSPPPKNPQPHVRFKTFGLLKAQLVQAGWELSCIFFQPSARNVNHQGIFKDQWCSLPSEKYLLKLTSGSKLLHVFFSATEDPGRKGCTWKEFLVY